MSRNKYGFEAKKKYTTAQFSLFKLKGSVEEICCTCDPAHPSTISAATTLLLLDGSLEWHARR